MLMDIDFKSLFVALKFDKGKIKPTEDNFPKILLSFIRWVQSGERKSSKGTLSWKDLT